MTAGRAQLRRDPFGRRTLVRELIPEQDRPGDGCDWCGGPGRFRYTWERDGVAPLVRIVGPRVRPAFCSVGCWGSYNSW